ncbi:MAG: DUF3164 family protein [Treponema sp.]|jgi:hypothetical protein|nr:DUF3164 family protein [Treponema sp.]
MNTTVTNEGMSGYMQDSQGRLVPVDRVKDIDKLRDQTVKEIVTKAQNMQETITRFKAEIKSDLVSYLSLSYEKYGRKFGGKKGNIRMVSYDGSLRLDLDVNKTLCFDERLQIAKSLIDDCITRWAQGSSSELKALIQDAFQVDHQGTVNTARILGLRRLNIEDPQWKRAMEAINDSIQIIGAKEYIRFYIRDEQGKYQPISLDFAAL